MKIHLSPITEQDGELIVKWRNSEKIKEHCFSKKDISIESNKKFFNENILTGKYKQYIVYRIEEQYGVAAYPIATVYLKDMDYENKRCELCIFTSDDEEWNSDSQSIAIKMLIDKAFHEFKMHKVYSYVIENNRDEVELLKSAGMVEEARLMQESVSSKGEYENIIRMCIIND